MESELLVASMDISLDSPTDPILLHLVVLEDKDLLDPLLEV